MLFSILNRIRPLTFFIASLLLLLLWTTLTIPHILRDKKQFGTPDLRNRIVGSRIIIHKESISPYFYKWNHRDGNNFLDPYDSPGLPMNRNTVTPFTLQLLQPISDIKYQHLVIIWYVAEITALLIISVLLMGLASGFSNKFLILLISLSGIGLSQAWFLHNLSGQIYIFIPLLLSVLLYTFKGSPDKNNLISAIILSILVLFRPNSLIFILPFVVLQKWKIILYTFFLITLYFVYLIVTDTIWIWQDYFQAVNLWALDVGTYGNMKSYLQLSNINELEGSTSLNQPGFLVFLEDSSILGLAKRFLHISLTRSQLGIFTLGGFGLLILLLIKKIRHFDPYKLILATFLLYFWSELCIPAIRNSYNAVQWIFPLSIIYLSGKTSTLVNIIVLIGFIFAAGLLKVLPFDLFISELLFSVAAIIYLTKNNKVNA